jgi:hypothetical protein
MVLRHSSNRQSRTFRSAQIARLRPRHSGPVNGYTPFQAARARHSSRQSRRQSSRASPVHRSAGKKQRPPPVPHAPQSRPGLLPRQRPRLRTINPKGRTRPSARSATPSSLRAKRHPALPDSDDLALLRDRKASEDRVFGALKGYLRITIALVRGHRSSATVCLGGRARHQLQLFAIRTQSLKWFR